MYLAAPDFNPHSDVCAAFLSTVITRPVVRFGLLQITRIAEDPIDFDIKEVMPRNLVPARRLRDFALSVGETLYYRLDESSPPVFWKIGKRGSDGTLKLLSTKRPKDLVVIKTRRRIQLQGETVPLDVDVSQCGSAWTSDGREAKLLGVIGQANARRVVLAEIEGDRVRKYAVMPQADFREWKAMSDDRLPSWRDLVMPTARAVRPR